MSSVKKNRYYSSAFKIDVVERINSGEATAAEMSKKLGVNVGNIYRWQSEYERGLLEPECGGPYETDKILRLENRLLKEKVAELYLQLEHLKKLESYARRKKNARTSVITGDNLDQFKKPARS